MTLREVLGDDVRGLRDRFERVLDQEDAIVILVDRTGAITHYHGFGASGCQLELSSGQVDVALGEIVGPARAVSDGQTASAEMTQ